MTKRTVIRGTGRYVPDRCVRNVDLEKVLDVSEQWIRQRTGIEHRYWVFDGDDIGVSDLGYEAAIIALQRAGWTAEDLDLIIFGTLSPDYFMPGSGCVLQHKFNLLDTPTLDIRQQCTAFIYGLATADAFIKSGQAEKILFVGSEIHSRVLDISPKGRNVAILFGDGAAAVCLEGVETDAQIGVLASIMLPRGKNAKDLIVEAPSFRCSPFISEELILQGRHYPYMNGVKIFNLAAKLLPKVADEVLEKSRLSIDDIDLVIPHQANLRINTFFGDMMNLPAEKVFHNIQRYGNTTAASIPIALDEALEDQLVGEGSTVLFVALGAGLTWGGLIYRF